MALEKESPQTSFALRQSSRLNEGRDRILSDIARGRPLAEVLSRITRLVDELSDGCRCMILLFDAETSRITIGASPSLPESYQRVLDGMFVDARTGSCGAALHRRCTVVIEDLATDPLAMAFAPMLEQIGLHAAVSLPILDSHGAVIGTFANYYPRRGPPSARDLELFENVRDLAGLAIERGVQEDRLLRLSADLGRSTREHQAESEAFTKSLGSELSTPILMVVRDLNELLSGGSNTLSTSDRARIESAMTGAARVAQLADDLNHYARTQRRPLERVQVRPFEVAHAAWNALAARRGTRRIALRVDQMPDCWADREMLQDAFEELLANALAATRDRDPAHIAVFATSEDGEVVYRVRDDGVGFDPTETERVFVPFRRLHEDAGSVTGLALVSSIVRRHGGRIWVRSRPGEGSSFSFTIPGIPRE